MLAKIVANSNQIFNLNSATHLVQKQSKFALPTRPCSTLSNRAFCHREYRRFADRPLQNGSSHRDLIEWNFREFKALIKTK